MILRREQIKQNIRYGADLIQSLLNREGTIQKTELKAISLTSPENKALSVMYRLLDAKGQDNELGEPYPIKKSFYEGLEKSENIVQGRDENGKVINYQSVLRTTWREFAVHYFGSTKIGSRNMTSLQKILNTFQSKTYEFKFKVILHNEDQSKKPEYKFVTYKGQLFDRIEISDTEEGGQENDTLIIRFAPLFSSYITQSFTLLPSDLPERLEYGYSTKESLKKGKINGSRKLSKSPEIYNFVYYMASRSDNNKTLIKFEINLENLIRVTRLEDRYFKQQKKTATKKRLEDMFKALVQAKIIKSATFEKSPSSTEGIKVTYIINPKWLNEKDLLRLD